jgi:hypothetical protein
VCPFVSGSCLCHISLSGHSLAPLQIACRIYPVQDFLKIIVIAYPLLCIIRRDFKLRERGWRHPKFQPTKGSQEVYTIGSGMVCLLSYPISQQWMDRCTISLSSTLLRSEYATSVYHMSWDYHVVVMSLVPDYSTSFHTTSHSDSYYYRD